MIVHANIKIDKKNKSTATFFSQELKDEEDEDAWDEEGKKDVEGEEGEEREECEEGKEGEVPGNEEQGNDKKDDEPKHDTADRNPGKTTEEAAQKEKVEDAMPPGSDQVKQSSLTKDEPQVSDKGDPVSDNVQARVDMSKREPADIATTSEASKPAVENTNPETPRPSTLYAHMFCMHMCIYSPTFKLEHVPISQI